MNEETLTDGEEAYAVYKDVNEAYALLTSTMYLLDKDRLDNLIHIAVVTKNAL